MFRLTQQVMQRVLKPINLANLAQRTDAFLVSYPKSGRTWFRFILSSYFSEALGLPISPNLHTMFSVLPNFDADTVRGIPAFVEAGHTGRVPLVAVSHLEHRRRRLFLDRPAIFMVRDPRDVMVSSYFHETRQKKRFEGDMDQFLKDELLGLPHLVRYLNGWADGLASREHVILTYEGLSAAPELETARVLDFMKCRIDRPALSQAVQAAAFERMQAQEVELGLPGHEYDRTDGESLRMRRGKVGGFDAYLTAGQAEAIADVCDRTLLPRAKAILARTGFSMATSTVGQAA